MKACLIVNHSFIPPEGFTRSIARVLVRHGFAVTVIGINHTGDTTRTYLDDRTTLIRLRANGVFHSPFVSVPNPLLQATLLREALAENADLYWCHGLGLGALVLALKLLGRRVIYDVGDDDPSNFSYRLMLGGAPAWFAMAAERMFRLFEATVVRAADLVTTLTESLRRDRLRFSSRIRVVAYSVDPVFARDNRRPPPTAANKIGSTVVYSGTISSKKAFGEILEAFRYIRQAVPGANLLVAGGFPPMSPEQEIFKAVDQAGVKITGRLSQSELARQLKCADVGLALVKPVNYSYTISLPFKLIEQMACGLPVVAPKGLPEVERVVKTAECGVLVDANDPADIARGVITLLTNPDLRLRMGDNAAAYVGTHHTISRLERDWAEVLQSLELIPVVSGTSLQPSIFERSEPAKLAPVSGHTQDLRVLRLVFDFTPKIGGSIADMVELTEHMNEFLAKQFVVAPRDYAELAYSDRGYAFEVYRIPYIRFNTLSRFKARHARWLPLAPLVVLTYSLFAVPAILRIIRRNGVDILCSHGVSTGVVATCLARMLGKPVVWYIAGTNRAYSRVAGIYEELVTRTFSPDLAFIVDDGSPAPTVFRELLGHRARIVWHGIDCERFRPQPRSSRLAQEYGLSGSEFVIAFPHALVPVKGPDHALMAFRRFHDMQGNENGVLLVLGDGYLRDSLKKLARDLGLKGKVVFAPPIDHRRMPEFFSIVDVVLATSRYSNANRSVQEAMACEKAVVAFDSGGTRQVVRHLETGLLARDGDSEDMALWLNLLHKDADLRRALGVGARELILRNRAWPIRVRADLREFENLLNRSTGKQNRGRCHFSSWL